MSLEKRASFTTEFSNSHIESICKPFSLERLLSTKYVLFDQLPTEKNATMLGDVTLPYSTDKTYRRLPVSYSTDNRMPISPT